ncbi:MAG: ion channel [Pseudomonadota bacterium]
MSYILLRERYTFWGLLVSLILAFTITPYFDEDIQSFNIFILASLVLSLMAIGTTRKRFAIGLMLGLPFLLSSIFAFITIDTIVLTSFYILGGIFFSFVIIILLKDIFSNTRVDTNCLLAAVCIYLFFAVVWFMLYGLVDLYIEDSFRIAEKVTMQTHINDLLYFSIVTLTTLGYGDITPLSPQAKSLATVEALIGQIYLTVLIARLVGLHIAESSKSIHL